MSAQAVSESEGRRPVRSVSCLRSASMAACNAASGSKLRRFISDLFISFTVLPFGVAERLPSCPACAFNAGSHLVTLDAALAFFCVAGQIAQASGNLLF